MKKLLLSAIYLFCITLIITSCGEEKREKQNTKEDPQYENCRIPQKEKKQNKLSQDISQDLSYLEKSPSGIRRTSKIKIFKGETK